MHKNRNGKHRGFAGNVADRDLLRDMYLKEMTDVIAAIFILTLGLMTMVFCYPLNFYRSDLATAKMLAYSYPVDSCQVEKQ